MSSFAILAWMVIAKCVLTVGWILHQKFNFNQYVSWWSNLWLGTTIVSFGLFIFYLVYAI